MEDAGEVIFPLVGKRLRRASEDLPDVLDELSHAVLEVFRRPQREAVAGGQRREGDGQFAR